MGVADLYKALRRAFSGMEPERRKSLFVGNPQTFKNDVVDAIADLVYESLACVANDFKGADDNAWFHVIGVMSDIYPQFGSEPAGMDPLQQHLALKLTDKLRHNMEGWYPAISRVLLMTVGPYAKAPQPKSRTAFTILMDVTYRELQKLPVLYAKKPEKLSDFLPPSVTFDPATNSLTHLYRDGQTVITALLDLQIPDIDLCDEQNWNLTEPDNAARQDVF
jgi:hypothetical protein